MKKRGPARAIKSSLTRSSLQGQAEREDEDGLVLHQLQLTSIDRAPLGVAPVCHCPPPPKHPSTLHYYHIPRELSWRHSAFFLVSWRHNKYSRLWYTHQSSSLFPCPSPEIQTWKTNENRENVVIGSRRRRRRLRRWIDRSNKGQLSVGVWYDMTWYRSCLLSIYLSIYSYWK